MGGKVWAARAAALRHALREGRVTAGAFAQDTGVCPLVAADAATAPYDEVMKENGPYLGAIDRGWPAWVAQTVPWWCDWGTAATWEHRMALLADALETADAFHASDWARLDYHCRYLAVAVARELQPPQRPDEQALYARVEALLHAAVAGDVAPMFEWTAVAEQATRLGTLVAVRATRPSSGWNVVWTNRAACTLRPSWADELTVRQLRAIGGLA